LGIPDPVEKVSLTLLEKGPDLARGITLALVEK
jgi:hypothetical protein